MTARRSLAFGDVETGLWGVAWAPAGSDTISVALGEGSEVSLASATLAGSDHAEDWRLEGDGVELVLAPSAPPVSGGEESGLDGFDQLCRAGGRLTLDGEERELSGLGWRSTRGTLDLKRIESFRQVCAWFEPDECLALLAMRPRRARGQESDLIAASVIDPEPVPAVADPRLSTTYDRDGLPSRAGLELWFEEPAVEAPPEEEQPPEHFPRRAAGEVLAPGVDWVQDDFTLHAAPVRWHSRGRDGAGIYLLGRRP